MLNHQGSPGSDILMFTSCGVRVSASSLFINPSASDAITQAPAGPRVSGDKTQRERNCVGSRVLCPSSSGRKPGDPTALQEDLKQGLLRGHVWDAHRLGSSQLVPFAPSHCKLLEDNSVAFHLPLPSVQLLFLSPFLSPPVLSYV